VGLILRRFILRSLLQSIVGTVTNIPTFGKFKTFQKLGQQYPKAGLPRNKSTGIWQTIAAVGLLANFRYCELFKKDFGVEVFMLLFTVFFQY
jgi:hypothetical protein